jgi:hypothetical protein
MANSPRKRNTSQKKLAAAWRSIWDSPEGRLAIGELLLSLHVYSEIQATDPMTIGIAVGERNVAARIARHIGLRPDTYPTDAVETVDLLERFQQSGSIY